MSSALEGLRVVDLSQYLAGPQVAMMLGDLGADVIRIDPPGGPRWNHPANAMLQRGKRSIALDLKQEEDCETARRLIATADVVIENFRPGVAERLGIGPVASLAANPRLIYCSMPGFGESDPRASVRAWEGVVCAAAGIYVSGSIDPDGDPVYNAIPYASSFCAMVAAHSVMASLISREETRRGQRVEVPMFDAVFEAIGHFGIRKPGGAEPLKPNIFAALGGTAAHGGFYQCADGRWIQLCLLQARHLQWFADKYFAQEWIDAGMADPVKMGAVDVDPSVMRHNPMHEAARENFAKLLATKPAAEWDRIINEDIGAPASLCQTSQQWLNEDGHAVEVGAVVEVTDPELGATRQAGFPVMFTQTPARVRGPRRPVDADRDEILAELDTLESRNTDAPEVDSESPRAALEEVRVVDTSQVLAGPTATRVLAEYGAQVTNVMSPYDGQVLAHQYTNNGKRSILLDFKTERGRSIYLQLADEADVVQENFTQGVADRLGVGERQIRTENPHVIYSGVSAYGHGGRRGAYRGREELGQDITGMTVRWGGQGRPRMQPYPVTDYGAGNYSAFGILVALYHRMRTGTGQQVHTSLAHAATFHQLPYMISFTGREWNEPAGTEALGWGPHDRLYRASDRWFYLAALGNGDNDRLATIPGLEGIDCASSEQLSQAFAGSSAADWVRRLNDAGIGAHVLMDTDEVMEDSATKGRGLSLIKNFPDLGELRVVGPSPRLSRTPARPGYAVGPPGADATTVLERIGLGEQLGELISEQAVHTQIAPGTQLVGRVRIKT